MRHPVLAGTSAIQCIAASNRGVHLLRERCAANAGQVGLPDRAGSPGHHDRQTGVHRQLLLHGKQQRGVRRGVCGPQKPVRRNRRIRIAAHRDGRVERADEHRVLRHAPDLRGERHRPLPVAGNRIMPDQQRGFAHIARQHDL